MRQAIINQWGKILGSAEAWEYHPHQVSRAVGGLNPLQTFVKLSTASPQALAQCLRAYRILRPTNPSFLPFVFSLALHRLKNFGKTAGLPSRWSQTMQGHSAFGDVYHVEH